jgi:predicted signal transduction protein with EAL and GGDEF domain
MARLRNKLSALVLWCVFLVLYLGGAVMLVIGLILSSQVWWAAIHQQTSLWAISVKTGEVVVMAVGLLLILIVPLFRHKSVGRSGASRTGRRLEPDCSVAADKDGPLTTL